MIVPNITQTQLSDTRIADADYSQYGSSRPVVRVFENGHITPGQWFASTVADSETDRIAIDFGQGWKLTVEETAKLKEFAALIADVTEDYCFRCNRATDHRGEH